MANTSGQQYPRDVRYRDRMKKAGFVHVRVFVPRGREAEIREAAKRMRESVRESAEQP